MAKNSLRQTCSNAVWCRLDEQEHHGARDGSNVLMVGGLVCVYEKRTMDRIDRLTRVQLKVMEEC